MTTINLLCGARDQQTAFQLQTLLSSSSSILFRFILSHPLISSLLILAHPSSSHLLISPNILQKIFHLQSFFFGLELFSPLSVNSLDLPRQPVASSYTLTGSHIVHQLCTFTQAATACIEWITFYPVLYQGICHSRIRSAGFGRPHLITLPLDSITSSDV